MCEVHTFIPKHQACNIILIIELLSFRNRIAPSITLPIAKTYVISKVRQSAKKFSKLTQIADSRVILQPERFTLSTPGARAIGGHTR